jgi:PAS domain S-box-containing protein
MSLKLQWESSDWLDSEKIPHEKWDLWLSETIETVKALAQNICNFDIMNKLDESWCLILPILNNTTDAIFIKNLNWKYVYVNNATVNILWIKIDEIIGKDDTELFSEKDSDCVIEKDNGTIESWKTRTYEDEVIIDGETVTFLSTKWPIYDKNWKINGLFWISRDISERKKLTQLLREKEKQDHIIQKNESILTIVRWFSHDFNNLLTPILWYAELISSLDSVPENIKILVNNIFNPATQAKELVKKLGKLSSNIISKKDKIDICITILSAIDLSKWVINSAQSLIIQKIIDFKLDSFYAIWSFLELTDAFTILINNSIQAIKNKWLINWWYIKVSASKYICWTNDKIWNFWDKYVHIMFEDNWEGIKKENLTKVFDPLFSTKELDSTKGKGLWLTIVYNIIINDHKWYIDIESNEWVWTTVHIYLPEA